MNGVVDPEAVADYVYDTAFGGPLVAPTNVLGRMTRAIAPAGSVSFSYDAYGNTNARMFIDIAATSYVEKSAFRGDGRLAALELYLPDASYRAERVDYLYDSASRLKTMRFNDGVTAGDLFTAVQIDSLGRLRKARFGFGATTDYGAQYAETGRRMLQQVDVATPSGSRSILFTKYDPAGRELSRRELRDGALNGPKTNSWYDALGRLQGSVTTDANGYTTGYWQYAYDQLGNLTGMYDYVGSLDVWMSVRPYDRDRLCRVAYGNNGLGGTACNIVYDGAGNVVDQPVRTGSRQLEYFASGDVKKITTSDGSATFRYDPFGEVQEINSATDVETRRDRRYGRHIEKRAMTVSGVTPNVINRNFPGPAGMAVSRRGSGARAGAGANVGLLGSALASKERLGLRGLPDACNLPLPP